MINFTQLVLASHNAGKLKELQAMLGESVQLRSIGEFSSVEPEETGLSFVENAILKARNAARISGLPALADDSGLAVDFLGGARVFIRHVTPTARVMRQTTPNCSTPSRRYLKPNAVRNLSAFWP